MFALPRFRKKRPTKTIEMVLDHDGKNWIASNRELTLMAPSLDELDRKVEQSLKGEIREGRQLEVFMSFNNEVIPMWMRPYMNHYFNRILELPLQYQP